MFFNRGKGCASGGHFAQAIQNFTQAIRLKPDYAEAHYNLALALQQEGKDSESRAEREKAKAPAPEAAGPRTGAPSAVPQNSVAAAPAPAPAAPAPAPTAVPAAVAAVAPPVVPVAPPLPVGQGGPVAPSLLESCRRAHWHEDRAKLFFLSGKGLSFGSEQLRTLRSRLYQLRETQPLKTVLVTSAMPEEGKTFICANLAYAFARHTERRVLLLDADLRSPCLHTLLGAPAEPGLTSYLSGRAGLEQILQRGPHENLFLIPGGKPVPDPAELLAAGKLKKLLAQLAPHFDWILLDSPAAAPVSDALEIAGWCDGVLLVVQGGKTPYDLAQGVTRELREKRLLGVVLNRTQPSSALS
jgi:capsular exopolysaccharide synthesis family protein